MTACLVKIMGMRLPKPPEWPHPAAAGASAAIPGHPARAVLIHQAVEHRAASRPARV